MDGKRIRIIFSPHPTGARYWYGLLNALDKITDALEDEYNKGNLKYDSKIKHLKRTEGPCEFCNNDLFYIADCPYHKI